MSFFQTLPCCLLGFIPSLCLSYIFSLVMLSKIGTSPRWIANPRQGKQNKVRVAQSRKFILPLKKRCFDCLSVELPQLIQL